MHGINHAQGRSDLPCLLCLHCTELKHILASRVQVCDALTGYNIGDRCPAKGARNTKKLLVAGAALSLSTRHQATEM